jgi:peptidoglycan-N-acetylglucosamine deacetylase
VPTDRIGVLMDGTNRGDSDLGLLSTGELGARRAAARRRRRRRRLGSVAVLALVLVAVVLIVLPGGSSTPGRAAGPPRSAPTGANAPPARLPRHARRAAHSEARAIDRVLAYTSYVQFAHGRRRDVALTFDDGPSQFTGAILRILRRSHTPATFFVIGRLARPYRQLVATEARDGFEVGDHTETHPFLSELAGAEQAAEIRDAALEIHHAGAPYPRLFRPPYGSFNAATLGILRAERMLIVLWSVDTSDYARPGVTRIIYTALSGARPGAIILMHDGGGDRSQTVAALPRIITRLRQRGFRLMTLSQLVAADPPPTHQPPPTPLSGIG